MRHLAALALLLAACGSDVPNGMDGTCGTAPRGTFWEPTDWSQCVLVCPRPASLTQVVCGGGYTGEYGSATGTGNGTSTPECVDTSADMRNCGACGRACVGTCSPSPGITVPRVCRRGSCVCSVS